MATKTGDYYKTLGVSREASEKEIKAAYRKLARRYHPDLNAGKKDAEERFKEVQEAYNVLSDPDKRKKYDRFGDAWNTAGQGFRPPPGWESFGTGAGRTGGFTFDFGDPGGGGGFRSEGFEAGGGIGDLFEDLFGGARPGRGRSRSRRGQDIEARLSLTLEEAHRGGRKSLQLQVAAPCPTCGGSGTQRGAACPTCSGTGRTETAKSIEVKIPAGARDGTTMRLKGQGGQGSSGAGAGDLYLHIRLEPHPVFKVNGDDLEREIRIAPWEAALGTKIRVPTMDEPVEMTVPPGTQSGQRLRLRGKGLNRKGGGRGDLFVRFAVSVPRDLSPKERRLYEELRDVSSFDPRED